MEAEKNTSSDTSGCIMCFVQIHHVLCPNASCVSARDVVCAQKESLQLWWQIYEVYLFFLLLICVRFVAQVVAQAARNLQYDCTNLWRKGWRKRWRKKYVELKEIFIK